MVSLCQRILCPLGDLRHRWLLHPCSGDAGSGHKPFPFTRRISTPGITVEAICKGDLWRGDLQQSAPPSRCKGAVHKPACFTNIRKAELCKTSYVLCLLVHYFSVM